MQALLQMDEYCQRIHVGGEGKIEGELDIVLRRDMVQRTEASVQTVCHDSNLLYAGLRESSLR